MSARILALDASYASSGIAFREPDGALHYSTFRFSGRNKQVGKGLSVIGRHLSALCQANQFEYCIKEALAFGMKDYATTRLAEVAGIIKVIMYEFDIPLIEVAPCTMKKIVAGSGKADKRQVSSAVVEWFRVHEKRTIVPHDDNQSDALGILLVGEAYERTSHYLNYKWGAKKIAEVGKYLKMMLDHQEADLQEEEAA